MIDEANNNGYQLSFVPKEAGTLQVKLAGNWKIHHSLLSSAELENELSQHPEIKQLTFDTGEMTDWDSALLTFLVQLGKLAGQKNIRIDQSALPDGVQRLLKLATEVPERKGARRTASDDLFLARVGNRATAAAGSATDALTFIGDAMLSLLRLFRGSAQFRFQDLTLTVQQTGAQALGIVALISFLVGLILAYIGAAQLRQFGATIYVADLVGLGMARAMGAMMTGIIMAGRTGAAFAAQLGTMQVNEEVDALETMGISSMDFLVLPRMLALIIMMPLLCLYSDFVGILGGLFVSITVFDLGVMEYLHQTREALSNTDFIVGLINATIYGVLIAIAGCSHGIKCGRSSAAVGTATTAAVVSSILLIVIATAILTVIYDVLGI